MSVVFPCQDCITDCLDKMARKKADKKKKPVVMQADDEGVVIDPARIRFQHSKIRPYFSGCGRSVESTLESIRKKEISPSDLPPMLVSKTDSKELFEAICDILHLIVRYF